MRFWAFSSQTVIGKTITLFLTRFLEKIQILPRTSVQKSLASYVPHMLNELVSFWITMTRGPASVYPNPEDS